MGKWAMYRRRGGGGQAEPTGAQQPPPVSADFDLVSNGTGSGQALGDSNNSGPGSPITQMRFYYQLGSDAGTNPSSWAFSRLVPLNNGLVLTGATGIGSTIYARTAWVTAAGTDDSPLSAAKSLVLT